MVPSAGLLLSLLLVTSTCDGGGSSTVPLPTSDSTPPSATLELYNIPTQQGAPSPDNPEVINQTCCDIDRHIRSRANRIQVFGVGQDSDGIRSIELTIDVMGSCEDPSTSLEADFEKPTLHPSSAEPTTSTPGTPVVTSRSVSWTLVVDDQCVSPLQATSVTVVVAATAKNFSGLSTNSKTATLIYP